MLRVGDVLCRLCLWMVFGDNVGSFSQYDFLIWSFLRQDEDTFAMRIGIKFLSWAFPNVNYIKLNAFAFSNKHLYLTLSASIRLNKISYRKFSNNVSSGRSR